MPGMPARGRTRFAVSRFVVSRLVLVVSAVLGVLGVLASGGPASGAETLRARRVSAPDGPATDPALEALGSTAILCHVEGGPVAAGTPEGGALDLGPADADSTDGARLVLRVPETGEAAPLPPGSPSPRAPRLAVDALGRLSVLWAASSIDGGDGGDGGDVSLWLSSSSGGAFSPPAEVAAGFPSIVSYGIAAGRGSGPLLWWSDPRGGIHVLRGPEPELVAEGVFADLAAERLGFTHLAYVRDGRAYYRTDRSASDFSPEIPIPGPAGVLGVAVAPLPEGGALVALEDAAGIHVARVADGSSTLPLALYPGGKSPRLAAGATGVVALGFLRDGALHVSRREPGDPGADDHGLGPPVAIVPEGTSIPEGTSEIPAHHAVAVDGEGGVHVAFEAAGGVWYATDIPPPEPRFLVSARDVSAGEEVVFEDISTGRVTGRTWDFGDGASDGTSDGESDGESDGDTSAGPHVAHRYLEPGRYLPRLTVRGPGGTRTAPLDGAISVGPAPNRIWIPPIRALAGGRGLRVPVYLSSAVPIGGFQVVLEADPVAVLRGATVTGTRSQALHVEFFRSEILQGAQGPVLAVAALWDFELPFDGRVLPPGESQALLFVELDVDEAAEPAETARIRFLRRFGPLEKSTLLVAADGAVSIDPFAPDAVLTVAGTQERPFLRGDANADLGLDISDAIAMLGFLFLGGDPLPCPDAADANDDGTLDISDPIAVLGLLFLAGDVPLPYPYPVPGLDPTPDDLGGCSGH